MINEIRGQITHTNRARSRLTPGRAIYDTKVVLAASSKILILQDPFNSFSVRFRQYIEGLNALAVQKRKIQQNYK